MMNTYTLTPHALERLEERTSISPDNINDLMSKAIDLPYDPTADRGAKMFWSVPDDRAYLAFYNKFTLEVITIYEAYKWINGAFKGKTYTHRDALGRVHGEGVSTVRRRDVAYCLARAGLPPREEFKPAPRVVNNPPPGANVKYSHEYVARFDMVDLPPVTRRVKSIPFGASPDEVSMSDLVAALREAISKRNIDLGRVKSIVLELRVPKRGKNPPGTPIDEIELDQSMLRDCSLDNAAS